MKILISFLIVIIFPLCVFAQESKSHKYYEKDYQRVWCNAHCGSMEVILPDKARVDCVTKTHAIEFDFAPKWAESIGQALYYGRVLNKTPGIVLIIENAEKDQKYINRVKAVAEIYGITLWTMTPNEMQMFVLNGILLYVDKLYDIKRVERAYENKYDGRTHLVFENETESNMRFRSLCKRLFETGKHVSNTVDDKMKKFNNIQDEDKATGYIYVLQSRSKDEKIKSIRNLYKIGYSETTVKSRIKNAANEPTYLMAPVKIVAEFKTYNMNTQKFEDLLHKFLGGCQISIDVFDNNGSRHTPREWFQVPYEVIEQTVKFLIVVYYFV